MTNFEFPAVLTEGNGVATVTAFNPDSDTPVYTASETHPRWEDILDGLITGDPDVWELFDVAKGVMNSFRQVTERVTYDGSNVLFDGDPIHTVLANQLQRAIEDGNKDNFTALARFWEKLESNPNAHSREQAYEFLASHQFQITADGDVVGFKGVSRSADGTYHSWASSEVAGKPSAFVDGKPLPAKVRVKQHIGAVVTMPRSEVHHDPRKHCSRGLHVATQGYANGYGDTVLEVHVNPRDIVSVPNDAGGEKVRVCRYTVARVASGDYGTRPVLSGSTPAAKPQYVGYDGI